MDISNIYETKEALEDVISRVSLLHADKLHEHLWIKAENVQGIGANSTSINRNRMQNAMRIHQCRVDVIIETNNHPHVDEVLTILRKNGHDPHLAEYV